jgi:hypothetical protein
MEFTMQAFAIIPMIVFHWISYSKEKDKISENDSEPLYLADTASTHHALSSNDSGDDSDDDQCFVPSDCLSDDIGVEDSNLTPRSGLD